MGNRRCKRPSKRWSRRGWRLRRRARTKVAIAVVAGMQYAAAHPAEVGEAYGPAPPEAVNEAVPGAEHQPHMWRAVVSLREARRQLREAGHDKGGYRVQALSLTQQAIDQLREGIAFANRH